MTYVNFDLVTSPLSFSHHFQLFPSHYHPQLLSTLSHHHHHHHHHHRRSSSRKHHESHSIASEEEEEIARYRGASQFQSRGGDSVLGGHAWQQRWKALSRRVAGFQPTSRQKLSFAGTSSCPPPPPKITSQESGERGRRGRKKHGRVGKIAGGGEEGGKMWYDGPRASNVSDFTSELPFITKLSKTKPTSSHSNSIDESHSSSNENGTGSPQQEWKQFYSTSSILPPMWEGGEGRRWRVVHVSVTVGRVVVYCGEGGEGGGLGCLVVDSCPAKMVVVYQTKAKRCSLTRYDVTFTYFLSTVKLTSCIKMQRHGFIKLIILGGQNYHCLRSICDSIAQNFEDKHLWIFQE